MARIPQPSEFELQVLGVLWEHGALTVRELAERLPDRKPRAYTSVLSVMQVMEKKGFLTHGVRGKAHVYEAKVSKARILGGVMGKLVTLVFGGKPAAAVQALLEDKAVTSAELAEMRRLIEARSQRR